MENPRLEGPSVHTIQHSDAATDLHYALDVMEEYSHLGLDDDYTRKLRRILLRRIKEAEAGVSMEPTDPVRLPLPVEIED
jgi:hypothetical protein